jgi:hypothetical protein
VNKSTGATLVYDPLSLEGSTAWSNLATNSTAVFSFPNDTHFEDIVQPEAQFKTGSGGPPMYSPQWNAELKFAFPINASTADDCSLFWTGYFGRGNTAYPTGVYSILANEASNQVTLVTSAVTSPGAIVVDASYVYWADSTFIGRVAR